MRKLNTLICSCFLCMIVFFMTACSSTEQTAVPEESSNLTSTVTPTSVPAVTVASKPGEAELLKLVEEKVGGVTESSLYVDADYDGTKELFAAVAVEGQYQIWYCSSDGGVCEKVQENAGFFDAVEITDLYSEEMLENHIIINVYNMMGTNKQFSVLTLRDGKVSCLVPWNYGTAGKDAEGNLCMTVEDYDGCYEAASELWLMHTWKQTWLSYDKSADTYKEIPAEKIPEEEFLQLTNASEILEQIQTGETKEDTSEITTEYFLRRNGLLHVQCFVKDTVGNITAKYYTLKVIDNTITGKAEYPTDGIMKERLSGLEAE